MFSQAVSASMTVRDTLYVPTWLYKFHGSNKNDVPPSPKDQTNKLVGFERFVVKMVSESHGLLNENSAIGSGLINTSSVIVSPRQPCGCRIAVITYCCICGRPERLIKLSEIIVVF